MLRFVNRANTVTMTGLVAAVFVALFAIRDQIPFACLALVVCGTCDLLDGFVARRLDRTEEAKTFGGRLDSLADACSFGFAPVVLFYQAGLHRLPEMALVAAYAVSAIWRLAYFDTVGLSHVKTYRGLPTTFAAPLITVSFLFGFRSPQALHHAALVACTLLAVLMVSPIDIPKPGARWYAFFLSCGVGVATIYFYFAPVWPAVL